MANKRVKLPVGVDAQGNPVYQQISGNSEAERFMRGIQAAISSGRINEFLPREFLSASSENTISEPQKDLHTFSEYANDFYARYKGHLRKNTDVTQRGWIKEQCKFFGNEPIENISTSRIQDYINSIQKNTTQTINKKLTFLREILDSACEDEIILKNPALSKRLNLGGKSGQGIKALPREAVKMLMEKIRLCSDKHIQFYLAIMLYAGVRREELLGLRWEDIDFKTGFLHIKRAVTYPSSKPVVGPPKTKSSERKVAMPDELIQILKPHRQLSGYLIANENDEPFNDYRIKKLREAARIYSGLPKLDARELRHSFASMMHAGGR